MAQGAWHLSFKTFAAERRSRVWSFFLGCSQGLGGFSRVLKLCFLLKSLSCKDFEAYVDENPVVSKETVSSSFQVFKLQFWWTAGNSGCRVKSFGYVAQAFCNTTSTQPKPPNPDSKIPQTENLSVEKLAKAKTQDPKLEAQNLKTLEGRPKLLRQAEAKIALEEAQGWLCFRAQLGA